MRILGSVSMLGHSVGFKRKTSHYKDGPRRMHNYYSTMLKICDILGTGDPAAQRRYRPFFSGAELNSVIVPVCYGPQSGMDTIVRPAAQSVLPESFMPCEGCGNHFAKRARSLPIRRCRAAGKSFTAIRATLIKGNSQRKLATSASGPACFIRRTDASHCVEL